MLCRRAFRPRDCVVIIYGSITATISCLHYGRSVLLLQLFFCVELGVRKCSLLLKFPLFSQFLYILYKILTAKSRTIFGMLNIFTAYFVEHSENTSGLLSSSLFTTAQPVGDISRLYQLIFVSQLC